MDKQKSVSGYPFHNEETSMHPHSKIIRQDSETFIVEDENTICLLYTSDAADDLMIV